MEMLTTIAAALLIATGIAGLIVPVLPGMTLTVLGVGVWALGHSSVFGWSVFAAACAFAVVGWLLQYLIPGRRLARANIPRRSTVFGVLLGIVGFFVIPVLGLFIGFILGVFLAESQRLQDSTAAWNATKTATKAVMLSVWIELVAAICIAIMWVSAAVSIASGAAA